MCDQSHFTIEQRLVASVWVHQTNITLKTFAEIIINNY